MNGKAGKVGSEPNDHLPLTPAELNILLSLAAEEMHGYGIMREVERRTGGATRLGPGTLYRSIKQMLNRGWIEEVDERADPALGDDRRRHYRITGFGRRVAAAEVGRLEELVERARERGLGGTSGLEPVPGGG